MFGIGMTELLVIFVIGLLVLGPKRLPELARSLGRGIAEFRRASLDIRREFMDVADEVRIRPPSLEEMASRMPAQAGEDGSESAPSPEADEAPAQKARADAAAENPDAGADADAAEPGDSDAGADADAAEPGDSDAAADADAAEPGQRTPSPGGGASTGGHG